MSFGRSQLAEASGWHKATGGDRRDPGEDRPGSQLLILTIFDPYVSVFFFGLKKLDVAVEEEERV